MIHPMVGKQICTSMKLIFNTLSGKQRWLILFMMTCVCESLWPRSLHLEASLRMHMVNHLRDATFAGSVREIKKGLGFLNGRDPIIYFPATNESTCISNHWHACLPNREWEWKKGNDDTVINCVGHAVARFAVDGGLRCGLVVVGGAVCGWLRIKLVTGEPAGNPSQWLQSALRCSDCLDNHLIFDSSFAQFIIWFWNITCFLLKHHFNPFQLFGTSWFW